MADDDDIPFDDEVELEFDPHEQPTKVDAPYHCVPAEDFRALLSAVVVIERFYQPSPAAFGASSQMDEHRAAMERLCVRYGVKR